MVGFMLFHFQIIVINYFISLATYGILLKTEVLYHRMGVEWRGSDNENEVPKRATPHGEGDQGNGQGGGVSRIYNHIFIKKKKTIIYINKIKNRLIIIIII